jgi:Chaperone of endosialidase
MKGKMRKSSLTNTGSTKTTYSVWHRFIGVALSCFLLALVPKTFGLNPAPDGGYLGRNTAEGDGSLSSLNGGGDNTAIGFSALASESTGNSNTALGSQALLGNNTGNDNTAVGYEALLTNSTGKQNTATGSLALENNTADNNTAVGFEALLSNNIGTLNTAIGVGALAENTIGSDNTATGVDALLNNMNGVQNTAIGTFALVSNSSGSGNTANGFQALDSNKAGAGNTAVGENALFSSDANDNTAVGSLAMQENTTGSFNVANGSRALNNNTTGSNNTADGTTALQSNSKGSNNVALGSSAGSLLTTGSNNIDIGANVKGKAAEANTIRLGQQGTQKATFVAGIYGVAVTGSTVAVNSTGKLGVATSSARFKEAIKPMEKASEAILALKPVTFRYKEEVDPDRAPQFGLVAEEVEKVDPELVVHDQEGKPFTVRYEAVNAMLLNEFLKEHRRAGEQEAAIAQLKLTVAQQAGDLQMTTANQREQIRVLRTQLQEQAMRIQKMGAQLEMNNAALQITSNNHWKQKLTSHLKP